MSVATQAVSIRRTPIPLREADQTVGDFIGESCKRHATKTALVHGTNRWSYRHLDAASSHIAARIGIEAHSSNSPIAILLEKSFQYVAAWFGVLRSGRILVIIDPADPPTRIREILQNSGAQTVLIKEKQCALISRLQLDGLSTLLVDELPTDQCVPFTPEDHSPTDACLLIYTSGSTGIPKGVVQVHRNLVMVGLRTIDNLKYGVMDRVTHTANVGFILSTMMLMGGLGAGVEFHLLDPKLVGPAGIAETAIREQITCIHITPTVMRSIVESLGANRKIESLRIVRLAGEPLFRRDVEFIRQHIPTECVIFNGYGSSEINLVCIMRIPSDLELDCERIPAGHAQAGVRVLLLDEGGKEVPQGEVGEICAHSHYLALGYWQQPEETNKVFVSAPQPNEEFGDRMYRTGDLGRLRSDGTLEVLGRRDQQVKIRGVRIETAEVEQAILKHPGVKEAVAVKCEFAPGDARLVLFWVPSEQLNPSASELRELATECLPSAMRPSLFVRRESFPLTTTGKIHRAALTESARDERGERGPMEPAKSEIEFALRDIWEEVLDIRPIGVTDHFFEIGGHSLRALRVLEQIVQRLNASLPPEAFLRSPTIREMASEIESQTQATGDERIVVVHASGKSTPLWVIGSHRRTFFEYAPLLELLPRDRPIHMAGLNYLDNEKRLLASVEEAARELAALIHSAQPEGPMILLGHCMGGMIAMEVARLLAAEGRKIERVFIIEPTALRRWLNPIQSVVARWGALRGLSLEEQINLFMNLRARAVHLEARLRNLRRRLGGIPNQKPVVSAREAELVRQRSLEEEAEVEGVGPRGFRVVCAPTGASFSQMSGVTMRGYHPVMHLHLPRTNALPLTVIRAESSTISQQPYEVWRREWERFGGNRLEIRVVPGGHHSIMQQPEVRELAEAICGRIAVQ